MADESKMGPVVEPGATPADASPSHFCGLRWAIRLTGVALMLAGTIYIAMVTSSLLMGGKVGSGIMVVVVSMLGLGMGILILRVGYRMLCSVDAQTIGAFSFLFGLVFTFILMHILAPWGIFNDSPVLLYLLLFLYLGLSYWVVKIILIRLLLPQN